MFKIVIDRQPCDVTRYRYWIPQIIKERTHFWSFFISWMYWFIAVKLPGVEYRRLLYIKLLRKTAPFRMFIGRLTGSYLVFDDRCLSCGTRITFKSPTYCGLFEFECAACHTLQQAYPKHKKIKKFTYKN